MPRPNFWQRLRLSFGSAPPITPEQLADPNPTRRWRSARAAAGSPRPALLDSLLRLLADPDPIVRDESVRTLASWGGEHSLKPALDLLAGDPAPETAAAALDLLALLADPAAQSLAARFLSAPDPLLRASAARALAASNPETPATALIPLAADPDPRVRRAVCLALGRAGDPAALPALLAALKDDDPSIRQFARQSSARLEAELARRQKEAARAAARKAKNGGDEEKQSTINSQQSTSNE
jgi:HEAT repeat protein